MIGCLLDVNQVTIGRAWVDAMLAVTIQIAGVRSLSMSVHAAVIATTVKMMKHKRFDKSVQKQRGVLSRYSALDTRGPRRGRPAS